MCNNLNSQIMRETLIYLAHLDHEDTEKQVCLASFVVSLCVLVDTVMICKYLLFILCFHSFTDCLKYLCSRQLSKFKPFTKLTDNYWSTGFDWPHRSLDYEIFSIVDIFQFYGLECAEFSVSLEWICKKLMKICF